ncbi:MAG TPA: ABC transporter permease [Vicinamibacterales bacterium]|jgi:peptide/nickel transport system permease protein|nr:ABC transporter permease [Vicinamibacterales bacterium]
MKGVGFALLVLMALVAVAAPWLAPNPPDRRFPDQLFAPPTPVHVVRPDGTLGGPYIHPGVLVSRLERRFEPDQSRIVEVRWFENGRLLSVADANAPLLLMGADGFGRDIFSRLLFGARLSLTLAVVSTIGAMVIGLLIGGAGGYIGGAIDELLSRVSDFVLVLPAIYVVLALRAVMPLVMPERTVFVLMTVILAVVGWPSIARGVRAIVASELQREYAQAARAVGAGHTRTLLFHLLPATSGFLGVQATLLLPAFILSEATMSFVGLGFPDQTPSWGTMLRDAANVAVLGDVPWALAPAAAIFVVVLAVNLVVQGPGSAAGVPVRPAG